LTAQATCRANGTRNPKGQRSHECERGTQECVRHNDFNNLRGLTHADAWLPFLRGLTEMRTIDKQHKSFEMFVTSKTK
jgi:hypothetical protein